VDREDESLKKLVRQWGNAFSEVLLEPPPSQVFTTSGIDGAIGYRIHSKYAITFGDPICPEEHAPELATAFHQFCQENNLNIIYLIASEKFANWAIQNQCRVMMEVAEELIFDPQQNLTDGRKSHKLRNYIHHAEHEGVTFHEYLSHDEQLEQSINEFGKEWLKSRRGPQIHLGILDFFDSRINRRWFYVQQEGRIVGVALLTKLDYEKGWLLKYLLTNLAAPRGTSEMLMLSILDVLRAEGCRFLTYGVVAANSLGEIVGLNKFSTFIARLGFSLTKWFFQLDRRKLFWKKFHPKAERAFVLSSKPTFGFQEIRAILKSLKIDS
jgi:lysylphosphatidylglycerol synthetase-like protein (DUF2156 family)